MKKVSIIAAAAMLAAGCCNCDKDSAGGSGGGSDGVKTFGMTKFGEKASLYTLKGKDGLVLEVTDDGGKVVKLMVPDREGKLLDVTIGFDSPSGWEQTDPYFGAIIGRFGNRIADGKFTLDGVEYSVPISDATHNAALHGGVRGWDAYVWDAAPFKDGDNVGIVFSKTFPDGEQGFPGNVKAEVTYTVLPGNIWRIAYSATTDKATPVNLTQHVYFNMNGEGTILDQDLMIDADSYLAVDKNLAPVGAPRSVDGTPFDFRTFHKVGERIDAPDEVLQYGPGYDHNWCLNGQGFRKVAELRGKARAVEVWTDQIGLQFYAGNFIKNEWKMKGGTPMVYRGWLALETQHYPNTPNRPDFPSVTLKPGETYKTVTEYRFKAL